ncbi:ATP-grasp domain-containing protein [Pseudomonadales bacterium]|nr:ATP-grasp domain-containing protein [Pseudomonadales bacterium]
MALKKILILGASRYYSRCIKAAREAGYYVIVIDRNPDSDGFQFADEFAVCDIVDKESVLKLAEKHKVSAIVPINDYGVVTAAHVTTALGLRGISPQVAELCSNKLAMRNQWLRKSISSPKYAIAKEKEEFATAIELVGLPCIFKPAHGIGGASRGVIVVENESEINDAIAFTQSFYDDKSTLVESFVISESEHSVEVLVREGTAHVIAVSDKIKTDLPYRVDKAVLYPSSMVGKRLEMLKSVVVEAIGALGITNGAAHVELAATRNSFVLFELGARCGGGGTADPIVKHSSGVDQFCEYIRILAGDEPVSLEPNRSLGCCYYFLTPHMGEVASVSGQQEMLNSKGVLDAEVFVSAGSIITDVSVGTERSGFIITGGDTATEALRRASSAEKLLKINYV